MSTARRKRSFPLLFVTAIAALLAACNARAPTVYNVQVYHDRWPDFFSGAPGQEYLAVIWGDPFAGQKSETVAVVLDAVTIAFNRPGYRFSTEPGNPDPLAPRLAIMINPAKSPGGAPCGDLATATPVRSTGNIELHAALCRGDTALTRAQGRVSGVTGPDDERFREQVYQVAIKVFEVRPGHNPSGTEGADPS